MCSFVLLANETCFVAEPGVEGVAAGGNWRAV